jgi:uncharacterized protein YdhG (YjbR/CyaY superfamily)
MAAKKVKKSPVDLYLEGARDEHRPALEKLRKTIRAALPSAEECLSYGLAAFRVEGKVVVGFGDAAKHCAFYPFSGNTVPAHAEELAAWETTKGSIHFQPEKPLPAALVRKLIKTRLAEIAVRGR